MIYVKTDLGRQALKERSELMPRKYHFPFLMFDGKRDSTEILTASASHGFTSVDLYAMVQAGFIVAAAPPSPVTTSPAAVQNQGVAPAGIEQFVKLKKNASRWLEDILGPDAERLCLQIEECKNKDALDVVLKKIVNVVTQIKSAKVAADYEQKVLA